MQTTFQKLISHVGSQYAVAKSFGLSRQAISLWQKTGIPPEHALKAEQITDGFVKAIDVLQEREQLRT